MRKNDETNGVYTKEKKWFLKWMTWFFRCFFFFFHFFHDCERNVGEDDDAFTQLSEPGKTKNCAKVLLFLWRLDNFIDDIFICESTGGGGSAMCAIKVYYSNYTQLITLDRKFIENRILLVQKNYHQTVNFWDGKETVENHFAEIIYFY